MFSKQGRDQRGFSLVQVLMAIGITSVISIVLAQTLYDMTNMQHRARIENELMDRIEDMRMAMVRSDACLLSWNTIGKTISNSNDFPVNLKQIFDENHQVLFEVGREFITANSSPDAKFGFLVVREIKGELSKSTPEWKPNSLMLVDLGVLVEATKDGTGSAATSRVKFGSQTMLKRFSITIETGSNGEIVSCNSVDVKERRKFEKAVCESLGGKMLPPSEDICDLRASTSIIEATCESVGMVRKGDHCE